MAKDLNDSNPASSVAVDGMVSTAHPKAYVVMVPSCEELPVAARSATLGGEDLAAVFVAERDEDLDAYVSTSGVLVEEVRLPSEPAARQTVG